MILSITTVRMSRTNLFYLGKCQGSTSSLTVKDLVSIFCSSGTVATFPRGQMGSMQVPQLPEAITRGMH